MVILQLIVMPPPPDERPDDLVTADYVARRFGCSVSSVRQGKCGTGGVRAVSRDPWRAVRSQVEAEHARLVEAAAPARARPTLVRRGGARSKPAA